MATIRNIYFGMFYWCYELSFRQSDEDVRVVTAWLVVTAWQFLALAIGSVVVEIIFKVGWLLDGYGHAACAVVLLLLMNYAGYIRNHRGKASVDSFRSRPSMSLIQLRSAALLTIIATFGVFVVSVLFLRGE